MKKEWIYKNFKGDPIIWFIAFSLSVLSILVVYSATGSLAYKFRAGNTEHYLFKHTMLVGLSFFAMWFAHRIDYRYYSTLSRLALWLSVPLLFITWKFGIDYNQATRSIEIPLINQAFQPSDLAKLALIASLASMLSKKQQQISDLKSTLIPMLIWCGLICGLIAMTNFSNAALLLATCMLILFIGRVPVKYLVMLVFVGVLAGSIAFSFGQRGETVVQRIEDFVNPKEIPFQAKQSYIAIASGGLLGKGPGLSKQRNILPNSYDDFIYAIIVEEYGLAGGGMVVLLYLVLLYRGMRIAAKSDRAFGGLLAAGLSFAIVLQAVINMAVVVGLGPVTGLPLPMVSMGGTSLLFTGISLGIVLSVSRQTENEQNFDVEKNKVAKAA